MQIDTLALYPLVSVPALLGNQDEEELWMLQSYEWIESFILIEN